MSQPVLAPAGTRGGSWGRTARLVWRLFAPAPLPVVAAVGLMTLNGCTAGLYAVTVAGLVNGLTGHGPALAWTAAFTAVVLLELGTNTYREVTDTWLGNTATLRAQGLVLERAGAVALERFLDPLFHDRLGRAGHDLGPRIKGWVDGALSMLNSLVRVAGLLGAVLLLGGGAFLAGAVLVATLPLVLSRSRVAAADRARDARTARPKRLAGAFHELATGRAPAAEVRLFDLGPWLRARWREAYRAWADADRWANRRRLGWDAFAESGNAAAFVAVLAFAAARLVGRAGVAGVFAGLLQAVTGLQGSLSGLLYSAGSMHTHAIVLDEVAALLAEPVASYPPAGPAGENGPARVTATGLRFRYPGATTEALCGLDVALEPEQVVALVGPNGAGKSTLAALLLGLYGPTAGGVWPALSPGAGAASAVLQDFVRFTLPVRDNVGFGDLARRDDDAALLAALRQAGADLQTELDLWLGTDFGGPDLSGGQWLRLALARGMLPAAGLVVLDEPTAAIDPVAEVDIVRRLLAFGRGRTAVVVSHRLGIARASDRILVLEGGRVVEEGDHDALRAAGGLYARMWEAQAAWYRPDAAQR